MFENFPELYKEVQEILSWSAIGASAVILVIGLVRSAKRYALAEEVGEVEMSSFVGTTILRFFGVPAIVSEEKEKYVSRPPLPTDAHLGGTMLDICLLLFFGAIIFSHAWPVTGPAVIMIVPIQICRNYCMKRKLFVDRLKGT